MWSAGDRRSHRERVSAAVATPVDGEHRAALTRLLLVGGKSGADAQQSTSGTPSLSHSLTSAPAPSTHIVAWQSPCEASQAQC